MKQETFIARHRKEWERLEAWLTNQSGDKPAKKLGRLGLDGFPQAYRRLCQQLALARTRAYSPELVERLQSLVQQGHQFMYRTRRPEWSVVRRFIVAGFPRLVRAEWRFVLLSTLLLYLPFLVMLFLTRYKPELIYSVYSPEDVANYESMYDPAQHADRLARDSQSDLVMFGFYVLNNVSIAFRTMAGGLFAGLGAVVALVMNGVMIGAVAGHLTEAGFGTSFWGFVAGHSGLELTAIVISGAAGLRLGHALLMPGRDTRSAALVKAGRTAALLVLGAFLMLVLAAFVEAYWSSMVWMPALVKYLAGVCVWIAVLTWLYVGGRHEAR